MKDSVPDIKVTLVGQAGCSYCDKAKDYLCDMGVSYDYIDLDGDLDSVLEFVEEHGAFKTVPQIVINGILVGGYNDLIGRYPSGS